MTQHSIFKPKKTKDKGEILQKNQRGKHTLPTEEQGLELHWTFQKPCKQEKRRLKYSKC